MYGRFENRIAILAPVVCAAVLVAAACVPGADTQPVATAAAESEGGGLTLTDLERYHAIEEIKQLKARYFRHIDGKDWDSWQDVFTPDAELVVSFEGDGPGTPDNPVVGSAEIVAFVRPSIEALVTVHHGHTPEIELTSPTTARGVWAMEDLLSLPDGGGQVLQGWGHYHETYERSDGQWRIKTLRLTRLRVDQAAE